MSPPSDFPWAPAVGIGLPVAGFAAGFIRTKSGKRVWDHYFTALRHLEGTIPMGMFETFHLSEIISPFAAPDSIDILAKESPELFKSRGFRDYLSRTTGKRVSELEKLGVFEKGLFWKRTGSTLGELRVRGGDVLATDVAAVSTGSRRSGFLIEWLGQVMGVKNPAFLKDIKETAEEIRPEWLFAAGGKAEGDKARLAGRYGYAMISSAVGRMNLLLKSPFDLEIVEDWVQKAPVLKGLNLGVKPGPAHAMLWRYTKKGALAFGAYKALDYADYLGREYGAAASVPAGAAGGAAAGLALGLRRGTFGGRYAAYGAVAGGLLGIGGEGPLSALAAAYSKVRIAQAEVADATGLGAGARAAEDYFPGLTKPATLVAAAATGLLLGGTYDWGQRLKLVRSIGKKGGPKAGAQKARGIYEQVDEAVKRRSQKLYEYHQARAAKEVGTSRLVSEIKSRYHGRMKGKEFIKAGAGRTAAVAIASYEALNIAGSVIAGDYAGAAFTTAATAGAAYAYAKKGGALGMGILLLSHLLREKEDPETLKRIYSGEEKVAIRSGRWWEMGRTPYEGKRPYYRPHRVALMRSGADKAALYGSEAAYWETDPLLNPIDFLTNPYAREELMWEQGYKFPVSRTPFEDAPVLGPVLAATIGRIIKPPKLMGQEEWLPEKSELGPAGMTETSGSDPIMRTGLRGTIGEQAYRLTELIGLPGFTLQSIKESLTGTPTFFEQDQYATPSLVSGAEPSWWGLEMGGLGMLCIPQGSPVQTDKGIVPIEEIGPGDKVLSRDSDLYPVEATSSRLSDHLIKVSTSCLNTGLKATSNHVVPVYKFYPCHDNNSRRCLPYSKNRCHSQCSKKDKSINVVDIPLEDVSTGDFLEVPLPKSLYNNLEIDITKETDSVDDNFIYPAATQFFVNAINLVNKSTGDISRSALRECGIPDQYGKEALSSFRKGRHSKRVPRKIILDSDLCYVLGWYAAEGSVSKTCTQFVLNIEEEQYAEEIGLICKSKLGASFSLYKHPEKHTIVLHVFSPILSRLVEKLVGKGSKNKSLAPELYYSSDSCRAEFLRGYLLGDGFINYQKRKSGISTSSRNLAIQSYLIGVSLGFRGHTNLDYLECPNGFYPQGEKRKETLRHYVVWTTRTVENLSSFMSTEVDRLTFKSVNKGSFVHDGKLYIQVKSTEVIEEEVVVYDLAILNLHYFTAEFISVHNSEGIRRYIPHRRNEIDYKNPLPSGLPSWLPGSDSGYFLDFSRGDIYTKLKEAPLRLPGKGLAALNPELQGVDPEYYSDFWRFKVLADVAPWSKEFGQYDRMMANRIAERRLTAEQTLEVHTVRKQVNEVKKAKKFQQYRYGEALEKKRVRIVEELEPGVYLTDTFGQAPITLAGVDSSTTSLGNVARLEDASLTARQAMRVGQAKRAQASQFLREYIRPGTEVDVFVNRDPSNLMERGPGGRPQVEAVVSVGGLNINRALVERGLAESMADGEALDPMMATSGVQRAFGNFWENLTHGAETPLESFTPLAPVAKFLHQRTALEEYQRAEVYGREVSLWQKPLDHFIAPGLTTTAWWAGWRGLPREVQEKYMVEEYFDRLEHSKYERLQRQAASEGDAKLAAKYQRQARRTKTGADIFSEFGARRALSSKERNYFREFVEAPTAAERREISNIVSPQMRKILHAQWARRASEGARMRQEAGIAVDGDLASIARFDAMRGPSRAAMREREVRQAQESMPVPGPNWLGWDPNAQMEDYKVKTILDKDMDAASYGVWRSDISRVSRRPWVQSLSYDEPSREMISTTGARRRYNALLGRSGHRGPNVYPRASGHAQMEFDSPGYDRVARYRGDPSILQF